jgi:ferredoxin
MSFLTSDRILLARRATQRSILALFWLEQVIDFKAMAASTSIDSVESTRCNRCLVVCPRNAYQLTLRFGRSAAKYPEEGEHHATQSAA